MSQLDKALQAICAEAVPYVLANWAMGVVMLKGLDDNFQRSEEERSRQKCDIEIIRQGALKVVALIPAALEARLVLLDKSALGSGGGKKDN